MSADALLTWLLVFLRAIGLLLLLPGVAGKPPPVMVRLGLALSLAVIVGGLVPPAHLGYDLGSLAAAAAGELVVGFALGFIAQMAFSGVELAGRVISSEVGLSPTHGLSAPEMSSEPLPAFLSAFAVVLFFLSGAHLAVITAFVRSFALAPAGHAAFGPRAAAAMIQATAHVIELGVRLSAPFVALNFLVTLAFATLGRAVPRMSVFVLSAPVRGLLGMGLLSGAGALFARYLFGEFSALPMNLLQLLPGK